MTTCVNTGWSRAEAISLELHKNSVESKECQAPKVPFGSFILSDSIYFSILQFSAHLWLSITATGKQSQLLRWLHPCDLDPVTLMLFNMGLKEQQYIKGYPLAYHW